LVLGAICVCAVHSGQVAAQTAASTPAQTVTKTWQTITEASAQYYAWKDSNNNRGSQIYAPAAVKFIGRPSPDWKAEFLIRSGYIRSAQSTPTSNTATESMTDTAVAGTWTYYGWNGVQPFIALNVNVPTAHWTDGGSANSVAPTNKTDADIIKPVLGEGWNLGPSVGANFSLTPSMIVSAGFGYTYRGPFVAGTTTGLTSTGPANFNPGDVYTANAGFGWSGERDVVQLSVSYSLETISYQNGLPLYRAGDRIIANLNAGHSWDDNWSTRGSFTFSHFGKNDVPTASVPDLARELFNSNSNLYRATLGHLYAKDNYSVGPSVTYLYRDRNGYDPTTFQFIPAKTSWSVGLGGQVALPDNVKLSAKGEYIWVNERDNPDKVSTANTLLAGSGVPAAITRAWSISVGASRTM
jgi:hypothetical protein